MQCIECGDNFGVGEMDTNGMCWACSAHVEQEAKAAAEEEAFRTLSTNDLIAMNLVSDSDLAELFAPWGSEVEEIAIAA